MKIKEYEELFDPNGNFITDEEYKEILRLEKMLALRGVPHTLGRFRDGWQVIIPADGPKRLMDAVQMYGSYGAFDGKVEIMHGISGAIEGFLTAEEACKRIVNCWKESTCKTGN